MTRSGLLTQLTSQLFLLAVPALVILDEDDTEILKYVFSDNLTDTSDGLLIKSTMILDLSSSLGMMLTHIRYRLRTPMPQAMIIRRMVNLEHLDPIRTSSRGNSFGLSMSSNLDGTYFTSSFSMLVVVMSLLKGSLGLFLGSVVMEEIKDITTKDVFKIWICLT